MNDEAPTIPADVRRRRVWRLLQALGGSAVGALVLWKGVHGVQAHVIVTSRLGAHFTYTRAADPFDFWLTVSLNLAFGGLVLPVSLWALLGSLRGALARSVTAAAPPPRR